MAETSFGVLYDGPALDTGEIAVADLAPALLALGGLFTETSVLLYPSRPPVSLNSDEPPALVVHEADVPSFDVPEETPDALTDTTRETLVEIVTLSYEDNKKWRLREGAASFNAPILDAGFWERVHRREIRFAEGDMLRVRLRAVRSLPS